MSESPIVVRQPEKAYHYTLSPFHEPVARVEPGRLVRIECVDAFGNAIETEADSFADLPGYPRCNPQTGPVFIEGAEPGDTLAVEIISVDPTREFAITGLVPGFGLLGPTSATPMLADDLPERVRRLPIRDGRIHFQGRDAPLAPFMGTLGTAPEIEATSALVPDRHGGNLDCPDVAAGRTVHLPVRVDGALFYCGDGHARQGDGEIGGVACEIPVDLTCRFHLIKESEVATPRITGAGRMTTIGCGRPLEDAARIACHELVRWVAAEVDLDPLDVLTWLTQVMELRAGNVVDPNYTMVASVERAYLRRQDEGGG